MLGIKPQPGERAPSLTSKTLYKKANDTVSKNDTVRGIPQEGNDTVNDTVLANKHVKLQISTHSGTLKEVVYKIKDKESQKIPYIIVLTKGTYRK